MDDLIDKGIRFSLQNGFLYTLISNGKLLIGRTYMITCEATE